MSAARYHSTPDITAVAERRGRSRLSSDHVTGGSGQVREVDAWLVELGRESASTWR